LAARDFDIWTNQQIVVFHGTDGSSAQLIRRHGIELAAGRTDAEFGQGFYTTTSRGQAAAWATRRARRQHSVPVVLRFVAERNELSRLDGLWFIRASGDTPDFWSFVRHCRGGGHMHGRPGWYDVVAGPVTTLAQFGVAALPDLDQLSFHSPRSLTVLRLDGEATSSSRM
jgi:hypothetical protein